MKTLKKIVLQQHVSPADIVSKKGQRWILGGSDDDGMSCTMECEDGSSRGPLRCSNSCEEYCTELVWQKAIELYNSGNNTCSPVDVNC